MFRRYGRLIQTDETKQIKKGNRNRLHVKCICDCGNEVWIRKDGLKKSNNQSCGCLKKEQDKINLTANHRHKLSGTKIWGTYYKMKSRCYDKSNDSYSRYGGRGIKVCDDWLDSFDSFAKWAIDNKLEGNLQIDRINNNKGYSPDNCRVVTAKRNARNRNNNIMVEHNGEMITLADKADVLNIPYKTAYSRYSKFGIKRSKLDK